MLKDQVGKLFPESRVGTHGEPGNALRDASHILVLDPILGSRFSLVQVASQAGYVVDATATIDEARKHLDRARYSLIIADHEVEDGQGLAFLSEVRALHPEIFRALVTTEAGLDFKRTAIDTAGLSFLLTKPWSPEALRQTIREVLAGDPEYSGWDRFSASCDSSSNRVERSFTSLAETRRHEVLLRGLLAGLNSCEIQTEVFELIHCEIGEAFRTSHWLWVDEENERATRVSGDWPVEDGIRLEGLSELEGHFLALARRSLRVTRLDEGRPGSLEIRDRGACLSFAIRIGGRRTITCVVWGERSSASALASTLRELQVGLQMAFQRIREAELRADAARVLARRVSDELRTPVGALTHAIDRLRGEAERAGLSTEWIDRVSSESERVSRAVEHLEGEMLARPSRSNSTSTR